ncbi:MAG: autotransporter domain-containing protein [Candidatus Contendobacter sp.]|nr:autotransporter domain-containing protein [Candidatus Contendobacter sp.]
MVPFGEKTTFTVTPADASYSINRVEGCGGTLSGNIYTTGEMIADCTVSASFTQTNPGSYTVTATADNNGRIDPSGSQIVTAGASITFTVNPNAGYAILTVTGCNGKLTDKSYTTGPITANCAVNARFAPQTLPADGALESVQAPDSAGPNQTVPLSVRFTEGQQPRPNTPVGWAVTAADGQPLPTNVTGRLRAAQTQTGADGIATNQFESGGQQFNYRIIATVNTQSGPKTVTFPLAVGLAPIVGNPTTPEGAMALYIDRTCANLFLNGAPNPAAQQLQFRCGQLTQITSPADAAYVMNQLTPRNNPEAANLGQNFNSRQLGNVLSRLAALRHGATGVSLSGLSINQNGQSLSASALGKAFAQQKGGAAGDEPGADLGGRLGIFVNGTINRGDKSRTTQESGFDYDAYDITGGVDYRFTDRFVAGFALGYSSTSSDLNYSGGNLDGSGYTLAGYANYFFGDNVFLDGVAQYGRGNFDMQRNINYIIPGVTKEFFTASASPDAQQWGASIGGGYDFKFDGQGTQATLSGHLNYLKATLNSYDESGAETFDLHVDQNTLKSLTLSLGGEISHAFSMSWGILTPRLRADWVHEFEDNSVPIGGWLLADPIGGVSNSFTYQSDKQDPNYFLLGAGASAVFSHGVQAFLFYQATLGKENYTDNQITAGVRFEF